MHLKKKIKKIYPVALFVYNRPKHTEQVILNLKKNYLAPDTTLYIFSDGPKNASDKKNILKVRKIVSNIKGFKKIKIFKKGKNIGLKKSIKFGVNKVIKKYGAIIVLEDDIVTSPTFLYFMNYALNYYRNHSNVWHISGWNLPLAYKNFSKTFFYRAMNCWGWATWENKWKYFNDNIKEIEVKMTSNQIFNFNIDGNENFYWQFIANKKELTSTWAIFWYLTIFLNKGFCVNPYVSLTKNIGLDGSGEHSKSEIFKKRIILNSSKNFKLNHKVIENKKIYLEIIKYYKKKNSLINKLLNKVLTFFNR